MDKQHELRLEWIEADSLADNPANWRRHPQKQLDALQDILSEVGWAGALLYNERSGRLIDGHARKRIAKGKVPVLVGNWTEEQERKILATLDPIGALAEADRGSLDALLRSVQTQSAAVTSLLAQLAEDNGIIPALTGQLLEDHDPAIDRAAELLGKWQVERGDLWRIPSQSVPGRCHRLLCGAATDKEDVGRVVVEPWPILMVTDPPFGVNLDQSWRDRAGYNAAPSEGAAAHYCRTLNGKPVASDPSGKHFTSLDTVADWSAAYELVPSIVVGYVWHASARALEVERGLRRIGLEPVQQIIWYKEQFTLSRQHYHWRHEPCFYVRRQGKSVPWYGPRDQHTVWQAASPKHIFSGSEEEKLPHPCQKPMLLFRRPLENHLRAGEVVYDPFLGSGTCMAAAEETGRICYGIDIAPAYVAVALERLAGMGLRPERA